jgi:hypothetical protein
MMFQIFPTRSPWFTIALLFTSSFATAKTNPVDDFRKYLRAQGIEELLHDRTGKARPRAKRSSQNSLNAQDWTAPFSPKGVMGNVNTLDAQAGKVAVAGDVAGADGLVSNGLTIWNGTRWTSLDHGLGGRSGERARITKVRLSGEMVLALGPSHFLTLDGQSFEVIRWDGSRWKGWSLDSGALASDIIHWNNRIWVAASSGLWEADSSDLKQRAGSAEGYAWMFGEKGSELWGSGKYFLPSDTIPRQFARWTGTDWVDHLPSMLSPERAEVEVFDFAWQGGDLFALAQVSVPDSENDPRVVMRWNGSGWVTLPLEFNLESKISIEAGPEGLFLFNAHRGGGTIWKWDGAAFQVVNAYSHDFSHYMVADFKMDADRIYLSGSFLGIDSARAENVAAWDGSRWSALSNPGPLGPAIHPSYPLMMGTDGRRLFFGGPTIRFAGEKPAGGLATWDGMTMDNLGGGLKTAHSPQQLYMHLASFCFQGEKLYVGGRFDSAGTVKTHNIAAWDGKNWQPLGAGYPGEVQDIFCFGNEVLVAGLPDSQPPQGSNPMLVGQTLGRWSGSEWLRFGERITGHVKKIFDYRDEIHIGGWFRLPNDSLPCALARWDGGNWIPLIRSSEQSPRETVNHAEIFRDDLFMTGSFFDKISGAWHSVAKWDGTRMTPFDSVQVSTTGPRPLLSMQSRLFLVGSVKGQESNLVYWDGSSWHSALSDPDITVRTLGELGGELYVYGSIEYFGGKVAYHLIKLRNSNSETILAPHSNRKIPNHRILFQDGLLRIVSPSDGSIYHVNGKIGSPKMP